MDIKKRLAMLCSMVAVALVAIISIVASAAIFNSHPDGFYIGVGVANLVAGCVGAWALNKAIGKPTNYGNESGK